MSRQGPKRVNLALQGGGAREALEKFWRAVSEAGWLHAPAAMFLQPLTGLFSPYQFNPLDINPLREVLAANVGMEAVRACDQVELFNSPTTGVPRDGPVPESRAPGR